jgi:hypothetical protein
MTPALEVLSAIVRPVVLLGLTGTVIWLAVSGNDRAIEALIVQFIAVVSFYFGERSTQKALKAVQPEPPEEGGTPRR